jgi:hypothetical protein
MSPWEQHGGVLNKFLVYLDTKLTMYSEMAEDKNIITSGMLDDKGFAEKLQTMLYVADAQSANQNAYLFTGSGLKDSFELTVNGVSFIPLQLSSERAVELVKKQKEKVARESGKYPPGRKELYEAQLELLANPRVPDFEMLFFPFTFPMPSPEPDKPYIAIYPTLGRPFTRGTIVSPLPGENSDES